MVLAGLRVVLMGRFASLPRDVLAERLKEAGAIVGREVLATTEVVVLGAGPWPLRRQGRLPRGLLVAQMLKARQQTPEIVGEVAFLRRVPEFVRGAWQGVGSGIGSLEAWNQHGPGDDAEGAADEPPASFQDWHRAKLLARFLEAGVSPRRLRRSLSQLGRWLPEARDVWEELSPKWDGRQFVFRLADGRLIESSGQRVFEDFSETREEPKHLPLVRHQPRDAFADGVAAEQQGDYQEAELCYRDVLLAEGPDADVCFNLANVLVARGQRRSALERLWQAVELSPRFAEAWHNLGTVALELGDLSVARRAFEEAIGIVPGFTAAVEGLAAVRRVE